MADTRQIGILAIHFAGGAAAQIAELAKTPKHIIEKVAALIDPQKK